MKELALNNINLKVSDLKLVQWDDKGNGIIKIYWDSDIGYGNLDIVKKEDGSLEAYSECMDNKDKMFIKKIVSMIIEKMVVKN